MAKFYYRAKTQQEEIIDGEISAFDISDAAKKIEKNGLIILELKKNINPEIRNSVIHTAYIKNQTFSLQEKKEFFNAFYFQYKAGLPISEIFKVIIESSSNTNIKNFCSFILKKIEKGYSLKESLQNVQNVLNAAYTSLLCAGEESGKLDEILSNIIKNINKTEAINKNIKSAMIYPSFIFFLAICVLMFFKLFIFKVFESMAEGLSKNDILNLLAASIIKIVIVIIAMAFLLFAVLKNEQIKSRAFNFIFNLAIFKKMMKNYYFQNFFTILSLSYQAGLPMIESLTLANTVVKIKDINFMITKSIKRIVQGCELTTALSLTGVFSDYAISQISSGEKSGELDKTFNIVAADYEKKLDSQIKIITKLTEPVMIIFVGILVFYVAINFYQKYINGITSMF